MATIEEVLDNVDGLRRDAAKRVQQQFSSVADLAAATTEQLTEISGIGKVMADRIHASAAAAAKGATAKAKAAPSTAATAAKKAPQKAKAAADEASTRVEEALALAEKAVETAMKVAGEALDVARNAVKKVRHRD